MIDAAEAISRLEKERPWFEKWREPKEFATRLKSIWPFLRGGEFLFEREGKWFCEAWALSKYAEFTCPSAIQLNRIDPPDGFVRRGDVVVPIEITVALEPGRKPALEFRAARLSSEFEPVERWVELAAAIVPALRARIEKKLQSKLSLGTELLVYLNIGEYGIRQREIEQDIKSILQEKIGAFSAIHVLWKEKLISSSGETRSLPNPFDFESSDDDEEEIFRFAVSND
jgi:hypothetical protein